MIEPWEQALKYLDTPFYHRGRTARRLDCSGLLVRVALDMGRKVRDVKAYGREPHEVLREYLELNAGPPVNREPRINDVLLMKLRKDPKPGHLGIVAPYPLEGHLGIIHTSGELGKVVYHILDDDWRSRIVAVFPWSQEGAECAQ